MKIRIELSKREMGHIKKTAKSAGTEIAKMFDEDPEDVCITETDWNRMTDIKKITRKIGSYEAETAENGNVTISINVKTIVVRDFLNIINLFYAGITKWIKSMISPIENFIDKYID